MADQGPRLRSDRREGAIPRSTEAVPGPEAFSPRITGRSAITSKFSREPLASAAAALARGSRLNRNLFPGSGGLSPVAVARERAARRGGQLQGDDHASSRALRGPQLAEITAGQRLAGRQFQHIRSLAARIGRIEQRRQTL